jgi:FkbM family methyltransferase
LFCHPDDPGFFVEFGAGDGKTISNTLLLEQNYGWSGVLCEPALVFRTSLESSRGCSLDFRCVSAQSGKRVTFAENLNPDMSGIQESAGQKYKKSHARTAKTYEVETISLLDLLTHHNAPRRINFLSIDTEGTEFDILYKFDFSSFAIDALTVEHNFGRDRQATRDLLSSHGFVRVEEELSEQDDWYVSAEIFETRWSS